MKYIQIIGDVRDTFLQCYSTDDETFSAHFKPDQVIFLNELVDQYGHQYLLHLSNKFRPLDREKVKGIHALIIKTGPTVKYAQYHEFFPQRLWTDYSIGVVPVEENERIAAEYVQKLKESQDEVINIQDITLGYTNHIQIRIIRMHKSDYDLIFPNGKKLVTSLEFDAKYEPLDYNELVERSAYLVYNHLYDVQGIHGTWLGINWDWQLEPFKDLLSHNNQWPPMDERRSSLYQILFTTPDIYTEKTEG